MCEVPGVSAPWPIAVLLLVHAADLADGGGEGVADDAAEGEKMKITRIGRSWHCRINDKGRFPVGHNTCMREDGRYIDRGQVKPFAPRWRRWAADVEETKCMVVQEDKWGPDKAANGFLMCHCVGYIGVFLVDNVVFDDEEGFSCDFVGRLAE